MIQAIIMCAGKSTRTYPLTLTRPKPLLRAVNKTILEHNLEQLEGLVDEVILIVGYEKNQIKEFLSKSKAKHKITFIEQEEQLGTAHAVLQAEGHIKDRFIVLNGDDFFFRKDIESCLSRKYSVLAQKVEDPERFGVFVVEKEIVKKIVEKPKEFVSDLANTGLYVFDKEVIPLLKTLEKSERGEYEIVDVINELVKTREVHCVETKDWMPVGYPWDLLEANKYFLTKLGSGVQGTLESNVTIKGAVMIGEGTLIKSGTYIEGPVFIGKNCEIGPNAFLRKNTVIEDSCRIGVNAEIHESLIMKGTTCKHTSYIAYSIIGEKCEIGAGLITTDYRLDRKPHTTVVNGKKIKTGRRKLGAFLGDNVFTGVNTKILPGRKIWPNMTTLPGEIVSKDKVKD